mgnify:CR=1 FL=1|jgi:hypothetical protein
MSQLPKDQFGSPIPALHPARAQDVSVTGTTAVNSADFGAAVQAVLLHPTVDMRIVFGSSTTTATDAAASPIIFAGLAYAFSTHGDSRVAAIKLSASSNGTLHITELE